MRTSKPHKTGHHPRILDERYAKADFSDQAMCRYWTAIVHLHFQILPHTLPSDLHCLIHSTTSTILTTLITLISPDGRDSSNKFNIFAIRQDCLGILRLFSPSMCRLLLTQGCIRRDLSLDTCHVKALMLIYLDYHMETPWAAMFRNS